MGGGLVRAGFGGVGAVEGGVPGAPARAGRRRAMTRSKSPKFIGICMTNTIARSDQRDSAAMPDPMSFRQTAWRETGDEEPP